MLSTRKCRGNRWPAHNEAQNAALKRQRTEQGWSPLRGVLRGL